MTLQEFIAQEKSNLDEYAKSYIAARAWHTETFPIDRELGDWDEDFNFWLTHKDYDHT